MKKTAILAVACIAGLAATADDAVSAAIEKGAAFLLAQQAEDGHWSDAQMPALTALPTWALCGVAEHGSAATAGSSAIDAGVKFVLGTQREDGGFYVPKPGRGGSGLGNYNTSVCLSALFASGRAPTAAMKFFVSTPMAVRS